MPWQNILIRRQIATDVEENLANLGEAMHGGISCIYLFLYQTNGNLILKTF